MFHYKYANTLISFPFETNIKLYYSFRKQITDYFSIYRKEMKYTYT